MTEVVFVSGEAQTMFSVNVAVVIYEGNQNDSIHPTEYFAGGSRLPGKTRKPLPVSRNRRAQKL